ncbi:MAG: protein TonB [Verrucomicrobiales bacterium]|jgi:protein TonB
MPASFNLQPASKPSALARKRSWRGLALAASLAIHGLAVAGFYFWPKPEPVGEISDDESAPLAISFPQQLLETPPTPPAPEPAPPKPEPTNSTPAIEPPSLKIPEIPVLELVIARPPEPRLLFEPATDFVEPAVEFPEKPQPEADSAPAAPPSSSKKTQPTGKVIAARPRRTPSPVYPSSARKGGIEGTVVCHLMIDVSGKVEEVKLVSSSGNAALDEAAIQGVGKWKFTPATRDGVAIASTLRAPIAFRLQ